MKEFDYTKWDNKPREMWVWNDDESKKQKAFVIFYNKECTDEYSVITVRHNDIIRRKHCAEIEQTRRMTNYELAYWLWEGTQVGEFRECCCQVVTPPYICEARTYFTYDSKYKDIEVQNYLIRVNGGEWKEPLVEE